MFSKYIKKILGKSSFIPRVGDRDFRDKIRAFADKDIDKNGVEKKVSDFILTLSEIKNCSHEEVYPVAQRFLEFFDRLVKRYSEILEIEWEMLYWQKLNDRTLDEIQKDFVNKTESFHQEVYANISSFIKVLSLIAPKEFVERIPIRSNQSFLGFIKDNVMGTNSKIEILLKSIGEYRVKYIDHTSQYMIHDWMTFLVPEGKIFIIYFSELGEGDYKELSDIIPSFNFPGKTTFPARVFFAPPHHKETVKAYIDFILLVFEYLIIKTKEKSKDGSVL